MWHERLTRPLRVATRWPLVTPPGVKQISSSRPLKVAPRGAPEVWQVRVTLPDGVMTEWLSVVMPAGSPGTGTRQGAPFATMALCTEDGVPPAVGPLTPVAIVLEAAVEERLPPPGPATAVVTSRPRSVSAPATDVSIVFTDFIDVLAAHHTRMGLRAS